MAPRYVTLPGEYAPKSDSIRGRQTWHGKRYPLSDVYFTVWKIGETDQPLIVDETPCLRLSIRRKRKPGLRICSRSTTIIPTSTSRPKWTTNSHSWHGERTRRHPLRTYLQVPFARALTIWFTPRTELLPIDGKFWPVRDQWQDSHADVLITGSFAACLDICTRRWRPGWNLDCVECADGQSKARSPSASDCVAGTNLWGIRRCCWPTSCLRTAFLTTVEAPEPRYVVSCYPGVLAFAITVEHPKGKACGCSGRIRRIKDLWIYKIYDGMWRCRRSAWYGFWIRKERPDEQTNFPGARRVRGFAGGATGACVESLGARTAEAVFAERREAHVATLNAPIMLFGYTGHEEANPSPTFSCREENFYYLTGHDEEGAALLLVPESAEQKGWSGPREILYLPTRNLDEERWNGPRLGPDDPGIQEKTGFAHVENFSKLHDTLAALAKNSPEIYTELPGPHDEGYPHAANWSKWVKERRAAIFDQGCFLRCQDSARS